LLPRSVRTADVNPVTQPTPAEKHRFHLLDALRGLAAILVVTYHAPSQLKYLLNFPNSFLAVDFFFCLSGFVIAFSYEERLKKSLTLRDFVVVRLIRLYPLYALSIVIAFLRALSGSRLIQDVHSPSALATLAGLSILLIPNIFLPDAGAQLFPLNSPAWSLFLELVANVAYGLLFLWRIARLGLPLLCLTSLGLLTFLALRGPTLDFGTSRHGISFGLARVGFSFITGIFLFRIFNRNSRHRLTGGLSLLGSSVATGLLVSTLMISSHWVRTGFFQLFAVAILFPALVYLGAACILPSGIDAFCAFLGDMSYPLYILHLPLMWPYILPVYMVIIVIVTWWIGHFADLPIRRHLTSAFKSSLARRASSQSA
jgi:peptidoglycan/LPS O-acetylase OafA/YrhL